MRGEKRIRGEEMRMMSVEKGEEEVNKPPAAHLTATMMD